MRVARLALAGAAAGLVSVLLSGSQGVCTLVHLAVGGAVWLLVSLGAALLMRGDRDEELLFLILIGLVLVIMDAFTTGYGLGMGLEERGPVARVFADSPGSMLAYFLGVEAGTVLLLSTLLYVASRRSGLLGYWLSMAAPGLGVFLAAFCNLQVIGSTGG